MQHWEYLTVYLSGALDFPDSVGREEALIWAGKAITQQLNEHTARGWELMELRWLSDKEVMATFKRLAPADSTDSKTAKK
jgi:hypothetical protein